MSQLEFIEHEHPEYGYFLTQSYGLNYLAIKLIKFHWHKTCTNPHKSPRWRISPTRVGMEYVQLLWSGPKYDEKASEPGSVLSIGRNQVAFTWEELLAQFEKTKEILAKELKQSVSRSTDEIKFYLKKIESLADNIDYCERESSRVSETALSSLFEERTEVK